MLILINSRAVAGCVDTKNSLQIIDTFGEEIFLWHDEATEFHILGPLRLD